MPQLTTEQVTTHTLRLTDTELYALRQAALCAIEHHPDYEHAEAWRAFGKLGKPATRPTRGELAREHTDAP
ncbi:hypothetical protein ACRJ4B_49845 [Streptomyces sp. GTA36]